MVVGRKILVLKKRKHPANRKTDRTDNKRLATAPQVSNLKNVSQGRRDNSRRTRGNISASSSDSDSDHKLSESENKNESSSDESDSDSDETDSSSDEETSDSGDSEEEQTSEESDVESSKAEQEDENVGNEQEEQSDYRKGGYHLVNIGDLYNKRYRVIRKLGWGHFSTVWLCMDNKTKRYVALKVHKSSEEDTAKDEIRILKAIRNADKKDPTRHRIVQLLDTFKFKGIHGTHICMVMEVVGPNLVGLLVDSNHRGIPIRNVKTIMKHTLESLNYLHRKCEIIHTDIKSENVLVQADREHVKFLHDEIVYLQRLNLPYPPSSICNVPDRLKSRLVTSSGVKVRAAKLKNVKKPKPPRRSNPAVEEGNVEATLADLGNACWVDEHFTDDIQTKNYESPETILRSGYDTSADIWSLACTAFEIATGRFLFDPKAGKGYSEEDDHLASFEELLGKIPKKIALSGRRSKLYFNSKGNLKNIKNRPIQPMSLQDVLIQDFNWEDEEAQEFEDFLLPMLRYDKTTRATAAECLRHPWLNEVNDEEEEEMDISDSDDDDDDQEGDHEDESMEVDEDEEEYDGDADNTDEDEDK